MTCYKTSDRACGLRSCALAGDNPTDGAGEQLGAEAVASGVGPVHYGSGPSHRPLIPGKAAADNVTDDADPEALLELIEQGCDLDLDVLPTVARTVPELPRPLKNWGAPWLIREILAARDRRLAPVQNGKFTVTARAAPRHPCPTLRRGCPVTCRGDG
jgi:hypothetical protein